MADIKIDHGGVTLLRPITAFCGTAPGTVTRRASVTADVFGDTYVAEFDIVPGETVTLPPPGPDETGVWRKVDGYEREVETEDEPEDDALSSLILTGESPSEAARRIRTELAALRGALADVRQQLLLANEAASRARDGEEEAKRELAALEWLGNAGYVCRVCDDGVRVADRILDGFMWTYTDSSWSALAKAIGWTP